MRAAARVLVANVKPASPLGDGYASVRLPTELTHKVLRTFRERVSVQNQFCGCLSQFHFRG